MAAPIDLLLKLISGLVSCFPSQELQRRRGGELRERSGAAAGGRAQVGGANEAQAGTRQDMHGETGLEEEGGILCVLNY